MDENVAVAEYTINIKYLFHNAVCSDVVVTNI